MDDITNKCLSEEGTTELESTDMKELAELSDTPMRDEVTEYKDNESPRNENAEEGDTEDLGMQLWSNHIIMREIMSHLDWRQRVPCELVCRLWRDAVKSLQRVNLHSYDFMMEWGVRDKRSLLVSKLPVQMRPMCAIVFFDIFIIDRTLPCENFSPAPCDPPCAYGHNLIEAAHEIMLSKRSCLLTLYGFELIYKPLPTSSTFQYMIDGSYSYHLSAQPVGLVGLCLPTIPNVHYRTVQYRSERTVYQDVYSVVSDICATDTIKGIIIYVKRGRGLMIPDNSLRSLLNYIKNMQPSIPYALAGCVTLEPVCKEPRMKDREDVPMTMGVFSVPKEPEEPVSCCQYNMYSLIIDSPPEEKPAIEEAIQTFARNISELQFSAALQLSCHTRQKRVFSEELNVEQDVFRATFPRTSVLGFYCNGIIGYSHPDIRPPPTKGTEGSSDGEPEFTHSKSTVFVYLTWGKQRTSGEEVHHSEQ